MLKFGRISFLLVFIVPSLLVSQEKKIAPRSYQMAVLQGDVIRESSINRIKIGTREIEYDGSKTLQDIFKERGLHFDGETLNLFYTLNPEIESVQIPTNSKIRVPYIKNNNRANRYLREDLLFAPTFEAAEKQSIIDNIEHLSLENEAMSVDIKAGFDRISEILINKSQPIPESVAMQWYEYSKAVKSVSTEADLNIISTALNESLSIYTLEGSDESYAGNPNIKVEVKVVNANNEPVNGLRVIYAPLAFFTFEWTHGYKSSDGFQNPHILELVNLNTYAIWAIDPRSGRTVTEVVHLTVSAENDSKDILYIGNE